VIEFMMEQMSFEMKQGRHDEW